MVPLPGRATPIASQSTFIELAVNMPEQEPPDGQALHSISYSSASVIWPSARLPTASKAVARSMGVPSARCPAFIGPPETNTVGHVHPQRRP